MNSLKEEFAGLWQEMVQKGKLNAVLVLSLSAFIFLNPFPHVTAIKEILYYLAVLTAFLLMLTGKWEWGALRTPLAIPFLLLIFWSFLSAILAVERAESLYGFYNHLLEYVLFYYLVLMAFDTRRKFLFLAGLFVIPTVIFSAVSLSYFYLWQGHALSVRFGTGFTDSAINVMGYATVPAMLIAGSFLFLCKGLRLRLLLASSMALTVMASVLTQSRGTIIALMTAAMINFFQLKKTLAVIVLAILVFTIASPLKSRLDPERISREARVALAYYSIAIVKDYPIFGTGYAVDTAFESGGAFPQEKYRSKVPAELRGTINQMDLLLPHNLLFNFAVRVGVPGLLLFLGIFVIFLRMCIQLLRKGSDPFIRGWSRCILAVFIAFFVKGMFEPITTHFVEVIYFATLAMGTILWRLDQEPRVVPGS